MIKRYSPAEYAAEIYHGKVTDKTVRNWIKFGKLPESTTVETTPTGRYILVVNEGRETTSNVNSLLDAMKSQRRCA